jgi:hypothetical protein
MFVMIRTCNINRIILFEIHVDLGTSGNGYRWIGCKDMDGGRHTCRRIDVVVIHNDDDVALA